MALRKHGMLNLSSTHFACLISLAYAPSSRLEPPMNDNITQDSNRADALGAYLKSVRTGLNLSLREVEEATDKHVSNAYLSQLENGKITKPSPHILHALAGAYSVPYEKLMERAGYIAPVAVTGRAAARHGRAATCAVENLTPEEEKALLTYLSVWRGMQKREKNR